MHNIKDFDFKWAGAYEEQFNVRLFNTAVRLATETTEAHKENPALLQKLAHLPWYQRVSGMDYFESREIRYFGELLERYGEKLGDDIANTRAVALAMAWTAPILTPNMFVGRQREAEPAGRRRSLYCRGPVPFVRRRGKGCLAGKPDRPGVCPHRGDHPRAVLHGRSRGFL